MVIKNKVDAWSEDTEADSDLMDQLNKYFLTSQRTVFFTGDVDENSIDKVIKQLYYLASENPNEDILMRVSSYGGSLYEFFRVYDVMRSLPCKINVIAEGKVMSAGFGITIAATGKRMALPSTQFLMHNMSTFDEGRMDQIHDGYRHSVEIEKMWFDVHSKHTNMSKEEVINKMARETYLNAKQAKKLGVIDIILKPAH